MKKNIVFFMAFFCLFLQLSSIAVEKDIDIDFKIKNLLKKYEGVKPHRFSNWQAGVKKRIITGDKIIALTFDACGGKHGSAYDKKLIDFLIKNKIESTLFVSGTWIDKNLNEFKKLSENPLFEIENHGFRHKPASVNGLRIYNINGTKNARELVDEVYLNALKIKNITGRFPWFYRSGTAHYDDVAVKICYDMNQIPVNFTIIAGDAERKISIMQMKKRILPNVRNGSIILFHMNRPNKKVVNLLKIIIPVLKAKGYRFVKLEKYKDKLI